MNKELLKIATDKFVRYCVDNGYGRLRLMHTMERIDDEEISIEDADKELLGLMLEFCQSFENESDAVDFMTNVTIPKNRYFHNVYSCLTYIAEQDNLCGGDKIEFCKTDFDDDTINAVLILNECNDIIADYIILN